MNYDSWYNSCSFVVLIARKFTGVCLQIDDPDNQQLLKEIFPVGFNDSYPDFQWIINHYQRDAPLLHWCIAALQQTPRPQELHGILEKPPGLVARATVVMIILLVTDSSVRLDH